MNRKAKGVMILFILSIAVFSYTVCRGYILPAEQIIQFMSKNFSTFKTLVITQAAEAKVEGQEGEGSAYTSKIWMKAPDLFRDEILEKSGKEPESRGYAYLPLLMANNEHGLRHLLLSMGIHLYEVAFTRIDGVVAYRIGPKDPAQPKLIVEKKRFLPLLLSYLQPGQTGGDVTTVRFSDYRKVGKGWFPYEITRTAEGGPPEKRIVQSLQTNTAIDPSMLKKAGQSLAREGESKVTPSEDERLKRVIRSFEKKYSP